MSQMGPQLRVSQGCSQGVGQALFFLNFSHLSRLTWLVVEISPLRRMGAFAFLLAVTGGWSQLLEHSPTPIPNQTHKFSAMWQLTFSRSVEE